MYRPVPHAFQSSAVVSPIALKTLKMMGEEKTVTLSCLTSARTLVSRTMGMSSVAQIRLK